MASAPEIASLRLLINEPDDQTPYTSDALSTRIDAASGDLQTVAGAIWTEKAARYAELVDVKEGSSSRALGDLYEQAIAMAKYYGASGEDDSSTKTRHARTRPIVRP